MKHILYLFVAICCGILVSCNNEFINSGTSPTNSQKARVSRIPKVSLPLDCSAKFYEVYHQQLDGVINDNIGSSLKDAAKIISVGESWGMQQGIKRILNRSNGKSLVYYEATHRPDSAPAGQPFGFLVQLNQDGRVDEQFGCNGFISGPMLSRDLESLNSFQFELVDGSILGIHTFNDGRVAFFRIDADGKAHGFSKEHPVVFLKIEQLSIGAKVVVERHEGIVYKHQLTDCVLQPDEKIVCAAQVSLEGAAEKYYSVMDVIRFTELQTLDSSFGHDGAVVSPFVERLAPNCSVPLALRDQVSTSLTILDSGKLLLSGSEFSHHPCTDKWVSGYFLYRMDSRGQVDTTFGYRGRYDMGNNHPKKIKRIGDDVFVLGEQEKLENGRVYKNVFLCRLNAENIPEMEFGKYGYAIFPTHVRYNLGVDVTRRGAGGYWVLGFSGEEAFEDLSLSLSALDSSGILIPIQGGPKLLIGANGPLSDQVTDKRLFTLAGAGFLSPTADSIRIAVRAVASGFFGTKVPLYSGVLTVPNSELK